MALVAVNIGSNLGRREQFIEKALELIGEEYEFFSISEKLTTEAWGFDSEKEFLNIGAIFRTMQSPQEILGTLQKIEKKISVVSHRDNEGKYKDREIDIDIMAIDDIIIETPVLTIPHRFLTERYFFLKPLSELMPGWKHPRTGESIEQLLEKFEVINGKTEGSLCDVKT